MATTAVATTAGATTAVRDRYIDVLRAAALVRVVTFHAVGWAWLPFLFPSMGIMFALGGGLAAASLDRAGSAGAFLRKRVRRLLLPFWAFGAVMLGAMLTLGWQLSYDDGSAPLTWQSAWLWVLPLSDPPASSQGSEWTMVLWYIRTYLWFLLLTPAMLWLFRRWPLRVMAFPVVTVLLVSAGLVILSGRTYGIVVDLSVYACCWLLGFAHHDGALRRLPLARTLAGGAALMAAGAWYAWSYQVDNGSTTIDAIPLANMLYSLGAVLILLRLYPRFTWLQKLPALDRLVGLINSRALTIYLWGNVAIAMAPFVLDHIGLAEYNTGDAAGAWLRYGAAWALIFVAVLALGWVEDVAAARRLRALPWGVPAVVPTRPAPVPTLAGRVFSMSGNTVAGDVPAPAPSFPPSERVTVLVDNIVQTDLPETANTSEPRSSASVPTDEHRPGR
jgi:peptidoglycan/LPS O-acetylase OafA/YrhL